MDYIHICLLRRPKINEKDAGNIAKYCSDVMSPVVIFCIIPQCHHCDVYWRLANLKRIEYSVTSKKLSNVYKSFPKMISLET